VTVEPFAHFKLDTLVTSNLVDRLFEPARLADILSALVSRRADKADAVNGRLMQLQREVSFQALVHGESQCLKQNNAIPARPE
jgi:hypothetical protein